MHLKSRYLFLMLWLTSLISWAQNNHHQGQFILMMTPGHSVYETVKSIEVNTRESFTAIEVISDRFRIYLLKSALQAPDEFVLRSIKNTEGVALAQFNHSDVQLRSTIPNDAQFQQQWSLQNNGQMGGLVGADIKAALAWDITTGGTTIQNDDIVVAVIDDGFMLTHPDLVDNFFKNNAEIPGNGIDDDGNGYVDDFNGWNAFSNSGNIGNQFHGTHVSGIIGAKGNNGTGVSGVNWNVKIMPIQGSSGNEATVVAAYAYAATMRLIYDSTGGQFGAYVVATNSSFGVDYGNPANYPIWCAFYDTLGTRGILSAAATANININIDVVGDVPTACPSNYMIAVTNTTRNDVKTTSAGFGTQTIHLGAPGTDILNTNQQGNYENASGTSMATPHVAGAIALMHSAACEELLNNYKSNPGQVALWYKNYLLSGVDQLNSLSNFTITGGRLNVYKAITNLQYYCEEYNNPPTANFSAAKTGICVNSSVAFSNLSTFNSESFLWIFEGGTPQQTTDVNPTIFYSNSGNYDVTLIAISQGGTDTVTFSSYVNVVEKPLLDVTPSQLDICSNTPTELVASGADTYFWFPPFNISSTQDPVVTINPISSTVYNVVGTSQSACSDTAQVSVNVFQNPPKPVVTYDGEFLKSTTAFSYQWYDDNGLIPGAEDQTYLPIANGSFYVVVNNAAGCFNTSEKVDYVLNINELNNAGFAIFPNPASEFLNVQVPITGNYVLNLHSITGKLIFSENTFVQKNETFTLNLPSNLPSGTYFLTLVSNLEVSQRFMVQILK